MRLDSSNSGCSLDVERCSACWGLERIGAMFLLDNKAYRPGGDPQEAGFPGPRTYLKAPIRLRIRRRSVVPRWHADDREESGQCLSLRHLQNHHPNQKRGPRQPECRCGPQPPLRRRLRPKTDRRRRSDLGWHRVATRVRLVCLTRLHRLVRFTQLTVRLQVLFDDFSVNADL